MRYVYAHFPINVNVEKNSETGVYEVEIRYVYTILLEDGLVGSEWSEAHKTWSMVADYLRAL